MRRLKFNTKLTLILIIFSVLFIVNLTSVGPEYDESLFVNSAIGCPNKDMFLHSFKMVGNTCYPIMVMPYLGATQSYFLRIAFNIFGISVLTLRITNYVLILTSLILIYFGIKKIFGEKIALITIFFLAFDPQFLLVARYDRTLISPFFLKSIIIYLLGASHFNYSKLKSILLGLFIGLMFFTKTDNIFLYVGIILAGILTLRFNNKFKSITDLKIFFQKKFAHIALFAIGFFVGISPYLYYLIKSWPEALKTGMAITNVENPILLKTAYLFTQFSGDQLFKTIFRVDDFGKLFSLFSIIIAAFVVFSIITSCKKSPLTFFLSTTIIIFYLFMLLYPGLGGWGKAHHYILIYPLPHILLSIFYVSDGKSILRKILIATVVLNCAFSYFFFTKLSISTCGEKNWSCKIRDVMSTFQANNKKVAVGDWGLATQLLLLSKGERKIEEIAFAVNAGEEAGANTIIDRLKKDCANFVIYTPENSILLLGRDRVEKRLINDKNYKRITINSKSNKPLYEIFMCSL